MLAERGSAERIAGNGAGDHRRAPRLAARRGEGAAAETPPSSERCSGSARSARRSSSCTRCSRRSSCSARGGAPSRVRRSTRSSICSCATSRTGRSRARSGRRSTCGRRSGSSRSAAPRTTPRCSRTTTRSALELARAAGQEVEAIDAARAGGVSATPARVLRTLHALAAADRYYANALELTAADDPERPDLLFRLGQIRWFRFEAGRDEIEAARGRIPRERRPCACRRGRALPRPGRVARRAVRDRVQEHMDRARSLVSRTAPSRIQAAVLTEASRYEMLANHTDAAVELGRKALRDGRASSGSTNSARRLLNNVGSARGNAGDPGGLADVEESIEVARRINLISEVLRGLNNAAAQDAISADERRRESRLRELRALAERYGYLGFVRFVDGGPGIETAFLPRRLGRDAARARTPSSPTSRPARRTTRQVTRTACAR